MIKDVVEQILEIEKNPANVVLISLIQKGVNINLNKRKIIDYVLKIGDKQISISQMSRDLKIEYKNLWRFLRELQKVGFIELDPPTNSQGKRVNVLLDKKYSHLISKK